MYERFTDRARKVMQLANQEAQRFNHEYIGTEHVLLALIKEGSGVAANALKNLDFDLRRIQLEVEKLVQSGPDMVTMGKLPLTPRAKKLIDYAMEEARNLNHNYVGTEHLLLGLLREQEGVAAQVLTNLGLKLEEVREEILNLLGHGIEATAPTTHAGTGPIRQSPEKLQAEELDVGEILETVTFRHREIHWASLFGTKPIVAILSWTFLALGVVGLAIGAGGDHNFMLPGAVLVGFSIIALALARR